MEKEEEILEAVKAKLLEASVEFRAALKRDDVDLEKYFHKAEAPNDFLYYAAWDNFYLALKNQGIKSTHFGLDEPSNGELCQFFEDRLLCQNIDPIKVINDETYALTIAQVIIKSCPNFN